MRIEINIYKLVEYDIEYIFMYGPWGHRRERELAYYVENHLLPMKSEEVEELFDRRGRLDNSSVIYHLRQLMVDSIESIFVAEYRKEGINQHIPETGLIKHFAKKFIPLMHADIRNAKIEYDTSTGSWILQ